MARANGPLARSRAELVSRPRGLVGALALLFALVIFVRFVGGGRPDSSVDPLQQIVLFAAGLLLLGLVAVTPVLVADMILDEATRLLERWALRLAERPALEVALKKASFLILLAGFAIDLIWS